MSFKRTFWTVAFTQIKRQKINRKYENEITPQIYMTLGYWLKGTYQWNIDGFTYSGWIRIHGCCYRDWMLDKHMFNNIIWIWYLIDLYYLYINKQCLDWNLYKNSSRNSFKRTIEVLAYLIPLNQLFIENVAKLLSSNLTNNSIISSRKPWCSIRALSRWV